MLLYKACPKCRGDVAVERDLVTGRLLSKETELSCLQCGYYLPAHQRRELLLRVVAYLRERKAAAAEMAVAQQAA